MEPAANAVLKRAFDIVVGGVFLFVASPLIALIAVLVVLDSGRPAFFLQRRVGLYGRPFRIYKFRSMRQGEHARSCTFSSTSPDVPVFYDPEVSRYVTRVGTWLRRTSLDELPQLWNVVRGEMSLVGPRPVLPDDMVLYGDNAARRCSVRPGITGLYQINGRKTLSLRRAMELDLEYVERHNILRDLWILILTPLVLLRPGDAN